MKRVFLALFFLPCFAFAQDCSLNQEKDLITNEPKLSTGFIEVSTGNKKLLLSVEANSREIDFFFVLQAGNELCFDNNSEIELIFEGGKLKSKYRNTGTMNCEGMFHINFKNTQSTPSALQRLFNKKIITMGFTGSDKKQIHLNLSEEEQKRLMELTSCLVSKAKTLLK